MAFSIINYLVTCIFGKYLIVTSILSVNTTVHQCKHKGIMQRFSKNECDTAKTKISPEHKVPAYVVL